MTDERSGTVPVSINGRFLGRPVTGVERFAGMVLREIDRMAPSEGLTDWQVLAPAGIERPAFMKNLGFRNIGCSQGHLWEQFDLWRASRGGALVNFCNSGPVLHRRQLTVIHDALVYRHPENFSTAYRTLHQWIGRGLAWRSHVATVSEFSRGELAKVFGLPIADIAVVRNAVEREVPVEPDFAIVEELGLEDLPFLLFIGSPAPNKNLKRAIEAFTTLNRADVTFVIVGGLARSFAATAFGDLPETVVFAGRRSDAEIQALYSRAAALVFPSIYEGFGIPPLEAMAAGGVVIAADIASVREVCRDSAVYFDPLDVTAIADAMRRTLDGDIDTESLRAGGAMRVRDFSWSRSASEIIAMTRALVSARGRK